MISNKFKNRLFVSNSMAMLAVFAIMVFLCAFCPYLSDDWHFKFVWDSFYPHTDLTRVESFSDIIQAMKYYYQYNGGRITTQIVAYILVNANKWVYNIANSLMFVLQGRIMYALIKLEFKNEKLDRLKRYDFLLLPLVYFLTFFAVPYFGDDVLWITGTSNYMIPETLLFFTFWLIERYFESPCTARFLAACPAILISASTNEVTGGMIILLIFFKMIVCKKESICQRIREVILILLNLPGMAFVLLAPGNSFRATEFDNSEAFDVETSAINYYIGEVTNNLMACILLIVAVVIMLREKQSIFEIAHRFRYFFIGAAGIIALSAVGYITSRPVYLGYLPMLIGILYIIVYSVKLVAKGCASLLEFVKRVFYIIDIYALVFILRQYPGNTSDFMTVVLITSSLIVVGMLLGIIHWALRSEQMISQVRALKDGKLHNRGNKLWSRIHGFDGVAAVICVLAAADIAVNLVLYKCNMDDVAEYQSCRYELWKNGDYVQAASTELSLNNPTSAFFTKDSARHYVNIWMFTKDDEIWAENGESYVKYLYGGSGVDEVIFDRLESEGNE